MNTLFPRETRRENDPDNEMVYFEAGWLYETFGWYCRVTKKDLCVEDFAQSKRAALRLARRGWRKFDAKKFREEQGFPRVCND